MAGKIKHKKPLREYAAQHGVSLRTIKRRSSAGLPLGDDDIGGAIPSTDQRRPEQHVNLSVEEAKKRRTIVQWLKEVRQLEILDREYLPSAQVREDGVRIGAILDAELSALLNDMPGVLAGLSELQIRNKLATRVSDLKDSIKTEIARVSR